MAAGGIGLFESRGLKLASWQSAACCHFCAGLCKGALEYKAQHARALCSVLEVFVSEPITDYRKGVIKGRPLHKPYICGIQP